MAPYFLFKIEWCEELSILFANVRVMCFLGESLMRRSMHLSSLYTKYEAIASSTSNLGYLKNW